jgi:hypothetical protein
MHTWREVPRYLRHATGDISMERFGELLGDPQLHQSYGRFRETLLATRLARPWRLRFRIRRTENLQTMFAGTFFTHVNGVKSSCAMPTHRVESQAIPTSVPVGQPLMRCHKPAPSLPRVPRHCEKIDNRSLRTTVLQSTFQGKEGSATLGHLFEVQH